MIFDALLIKASHAGTEKTAFYNNICMRHGEREKVLKVEVNLPVAYLVKTDWNNSICLLK